MLTETELAEIKERAARLAEIADQLTDGKLPDLSRTATATAIGLAATLSAGDVPRLLDELGDRTEWPADDDTTPVTRYWPEPAGYRDQPDGANITLTGTIAYLQHRTTFQELPYATGVLRLATGEVPFEVLPKTYRRLAAGLAEQQQRTLVGRVDRRGTISVLTITGCCHMRNHAGTPAAEGQR